MDSKLADSESKQRGHAIDTKSNFAIINPSYEPDQDDPRSKTNGEKSQDLEKDDYDPYNNRQVKRPTTNMETLIHLLKSSFGTGILAMPNAFLHSGYVVGIIGTILIGSVCTYCIHMLISTAYEICKRRKIPSLTYPAIAVASLEEGPPFFRALAPYAGIISNIFLLAYQIGTCSVYVMFISENLKKVIDLYVETEIDLKLYMVAILLPLILINWVRKLKYLVPFSQAANLATLVSFVIILYYLFRENLTLDGKQAVGHIQEFPLFFGTVLFALEAIGVMMPLENEMKTPQNFVSRFGTLNKAMIMIVTMYIIIGLTGYLRFGSEVLGSITLNLPGETEIPAQVVQILLACSIFITHGIACYVAIDITWNQHMKKFFLNNKHRMVYEFIVRTAIVLVTFILAVSVPSLGLFISLTGAFCISQLGLVFPAVFELSTYWYHITPKQKCRMIIKSFILITIGTAGLIIGTYTSIKEIIQEFSSK